MPYVVTDLSPVNHGGCVYSEGQPIPGLTPEQAAPLLALGVIRETTPPPTEKPPAK
jgi:hypothetical protein